MPKETAKILKARYEEREIVSFDHLRLHGYLCVCRVNQTENGLYWSMNTMIPVCGLEEKRWLFIRRDLTFFCRMREVMKKPGRISTVETAAQ
ncbi:MAG: hypothetical protein ACLR0U_00155 [Enterocloster clostridioformis]